MTRPGELEDLLARAGPQVLGVLTRRSGDFAAAEDAVQEALVAAAEHWPVDGVPDNPVGWLVRAAGRRLTDHRRSDDARRRREQTAYLAEPVPADEAPRDDDALGLLFLCCHPAVTPASAVALTLRALGGLTTAEIAAAFLVPEATAAQRISRAKARIADAGARFTMPDDELPERVDAVLTVLYLMFNEGYTSTGGPELLRVDLAAEAIRLARTAHDRLPDDPEVTGLLALMLLTDARRPARVTADGELVPLAEQDRGRWDRTLIAEGISLVTAARARGVVGAYQLQASIAAVHDAAESDDATDWTAILRLYDLLGRLTDNPVVALNRAVAVAMVHGPADGLAAVDDLAGRLGEHHRVHAVRGHLTERLGDPATAADHYAAAAARTTNLAERRYLTLRAARLHAG